jgi:hypothetical protein
MPITAPNRTSLRRNPDRRQSENSQVRRRSASRLACLTDKRLSVDARLVYPLLDDYAGWKGTGWPKQQTLSHRLGISLRRIQAAIRELAATGWIVIERTGRANRYTLRWAADQIERQCADRIPICNPVVMQQPTAEPVEMVEADGVFSLTCNNIPGNTGSQAAGPCPRCHGTYYITVLEYFLVGNTRYTRPKRVLCRCG